MVTFVSFVFALPYC